jgi:two-component system OmpR family response regulator
MALEDPHILVVDDHREIRESLAQFLRKHGRRTTAVDSADAARRAIKENRIDAVVLDIMMPGEDGLSLCRHIRETNHIPSSSRRAPRNSTHHRSRSRRRRLCREALNRANSWRALTRCCAALTRCRQMSQPPRACASFRPLDVEGRGRNWSTTKAPSMNVDWRISPLLTFLAPEIVLSRDQLLDLAFDGGKDVFDRAVDTQVSRLRRKIETDARSPRLIKTVWGGGYVFTAPVEKA